MEKVFTKDYFLNLSILMFCFFLFGVFSLVRFPVYESYSPFIRTGNFLLLLNAVITVFLVFSIVFSFFKVSRMVEGYRSKVLKIIGSGFLFYGVTASGLLLTVAGLYDGTEVMNFFVNRIFMVFAVSLISYGAFCFKGKNRFGVVVPSLSAVAGVLWFVYGLLFQESIGYTMFGFLSFIWAPLMVFSGYTFFRRAEMTDGNGVYFFSFGLVVLGMSYLVWPLAFRRVYYIIVWFMVNIGLLLASYGVYSGDWSSEFES